MAGKEILIVGDDAASQQLRAMLAAHNIKVLGVGLAAGLPLDMLSDLCVPLDRAKPRVPAPLTDDDRRAMAVAQAKRDRRAAKFRAAMSASRLDDKAAEHDHSEGGHHD
jgi:hypothetical protein